MSGPALGPFQLDRVIGAGGMGQVWRGTHAPTGLPVAVKLITHDLARSDAYRAMLRDEVRAAAALDHPHVVRLLDQGEVPDPAPAGLVAGSPWVAMELAHGGTLADQTGRLPWPELREALRSLLDALAHAHAHGVLHRDLKPANALAAHPLDERPGVKLADFGLARGMSDAAITPWSSGGTVGYVAPEQRAGRWRDQGAWTDLYALGRTAWDLVGRQPVPDGFEAWVAWLTAPEPEDRPRFAADARAALDALGAATHAVAGPGALGGSTWADEVPEDPFADPGAASVARPDVGRPTAGDWRAPRPDAPSALVSAGLGLWGLRAIPLVGREAERDALWDALRQVQDGPRVIALTGPPGVGKSRLAAWVGRRAVELGVATALVATHGAGEEPGSGLVAMLGRHFRTQGLGAAAIAHRLEVWLPDAPGALPAVLAGEPLPASSRRAVVRRAVELLAADRPVVVWLDDVQWSPDAVTFARELLAESRAPVLVVLTRRDGDSDGALPGEALPVGPLDPADHLALVRELLGFEGELAERIAERTAGNPLFAVHLVGDWVRRGLLLPGPRGFALRPGSDVSLPDDLFHLWTAQLDRVLVSAAEHAALEVAACLGREVRVAEWRHATSAMGLHVDDGLVERLQSERLVTADRRAGTFGFVHGMLREAVLRVAVEAGRYAGQQRAAADAVRAIGTEAVDERVGLHLLEAGLAEAALGPLLAGVRVRVEAAEYAETVRLLEARDRAARMAGLAPDHPEQLITRIEWAAVAHFRGRHAEAAALTAEVERLARAAGDNVNLGRALATRGATVLETGDGPTAVALLERAAALTTGAHHGRVLTNLGHALLRTGRAEEARLVLEQSAELAGDPLAAAHARTLLGDVALRAGRLDEAERLYRATGDAYRAAGARLQAANTDNNLGDVLRARGDLPAAERAYRSALDGFEAIGAGIAEYARVNIGLVRLQSGDYPRAAQSFEDVLGRTGGEGVLAGMVHLFLLPCAAAAGDRYAWDEHWRHAEALLATGLVDPDVAAALELAGQLAGDGRSAVAWEAAERQWRALGRSADADRVARRMA